MYRLIKSEGLRSFAERESAALLVSMLTAELFYKFHSFSLECGAMLSTWLVLGWARDKLTRPHTSNSELSAAE